MANKTLDELPEEVKIQLLKIASNAEMMKNEKSEISSRERLKSFVKGGKPKEKTATIIQQKEKEDEY